MFNQNVPSYMRAYFDRNKPKEDVKPIVMSKAEEKEVKFERASEKIKMSEDAKKKPPTEKEMSIDDYIELLKEDGNRKYYIQLLESLKE